MRVEKLEALEQSKKYYGKESKEGKEGKEGKAPIVFGSSYLKSSFLWKEFLFL